MSDQAFQTATCIKAGYLVRETAGRVSGFINQALRLHTCQETLGDDILYYLQVVLHGLVLGVGALHLLVGEETEEQRLVLELALFQD